MVFGYFEGATSKQESAAARRKKDVYSVLNGKTSARRQFSMAHEKKEPDFRLPANDLMKKVR
jgi:hypothetical protein